jgi:hypothetical protein
MKLGRRKLYNTVFPVKMTGCEQKGGGMEGEKE